MFMRKLLYSLLCISSFSTSAFAQNVETLTLFGPEAFQGQPKSASYVRTFSAPAGLQNTRLELVNGAGMEGLLEPCGDSRNFGQLLKCLSGNLRALLVPRRRALAVEVKLNGQIVLAQKMGALDFSKIKPVATATQNNLEVKVTGPKNSFVTIRIRGDKVNRAPVPNLIVTQSEDVAPSRVLFDARQSIDPDGHELGYEWDFGDGSPIAAGSTATHEFLQPGSYNVQLTVTDSLGLSATASATAMVIGPPTVPDPADFAPPLPEATPVTIGEQLNFIYEGPSPIQTNVTPNAIAPDRLGHLRGQVVDELSQPLKGVRVSILEHPEYGETHTRDDGLFDLVVNGGRSLTVQYERSGYLPTQRKIEVTGNIALNLERVMLIRPDQKVTSIQNQATESQVVQGSAVQDSQGTRIATLIFPPQTEAEVILPNGSSKVLPTLNIRATEYTVGPSGPERMPGPLPPQSSYTYAVSLNADEAIALGADSVRFSNPVPFYVDNFLSIPVGTAVPLGTYDTQMGAWKSELDGIVLSILSEINGQAVVDVRGQGQPATAQELSDLGLTPAELGRLANLYDPGKSLWRVRLNHFSSIDLNFLIADNRTANRGKPPETNEPPPDQPPCAGVVACVIDLSRRTLGEEIKLPGVPFSLNYSTDRQLGYLGNNNYSVDLTGPVIISLTKVEVETHVAGRVFKESFQATENLRYTFDDWDGKDIFGRQLLSATKARVIISYIGNELRYACPWRPNTESWGLWVPSGCTAIPTGREITRKYPFEITLGPNLIPGTQGVAGWTPSIHHFFDTRGQRFLSGDGSVRATNQLMKKVSVIAGNGLQGGVGDGGPARQARLRSPRGLAVDQDGTIYFSDGCCMIRKISPNGIITRFAGSGVAGFSGDGGPALDATFGNIGRLSVMQDGRILLTDTPNHVLRTIDRSGIVRTIAGTGGVAGYFGDNGPATQALLNEPLGAILSSDDSIYFVDSANHVLRRIDPSGTIQTVAGTGIPGFSGDGGPAINAQFNNPAFCTEGPDGTIFVADRANHVIRAIGQNGIIETVAGTPMTPGYSGDGGLATGARFRFPQDMAINRSGELFVVDQNNNVIRKINSDGGISTAIGGGLQLGIGSPVGSSEVLLNDPVNIAWNPLDDSMIINDRLNFVIRKYENLWTSFNGIYNIASENGREIYQFDESGRHLTTRSILTNQVLYQFEYDPESRLTGIRDGYGALSRIERDSSGQPTRIVGPDGHIINLEVSGGNLTAVTLPEGERTEIGYGSGSLMTSFRRPAGQVYSYQYDSLGKITREENPAGGFLSFSDNNSLTEMIDSLGRTRKYRAYSAIEDGRNYDITDAAGLVTTRSRLGQANAVLRRYPDNTSTLAFRALDPLSGSSEYDSFSATSGFGVQHDQVTETRTLTPVSASDFSYQIRTSFVNRVETTTYTSQNKTYTRTTGLGEISTITIDEFEKPVRIQVGGFLPVEIFYDARGRISRTQQGDRETLLSYGVNGDVETVTDALGRATTLTYDRSSRLTRTTFADQRDIQAAYTPNGNVASVVLPNNFVHEMFFGLLDLLANYTAPVVDGSGGSVSLAYNDQKQLVSITRADNRINSISYDSAGRVIASGDSTSFSRFSYLPTGQQNATTSSDLVGITKTFSGPTVLGRSYNGRVSGTVNSTYFDENNLASETLMGLTLNYTYDQDIRLASTGPMNIARDTASGLITSLSLQNSSREFTYSGFGELEVNESKFNGGSIFKQEFLRDKLGRIVKNIETVQGVTTTFDYLFDLTGRLVGVNRNGAVYSSYGYDLNNNRVNAVVNGQAFSGAYDAQDRVVSYGNYAYTFTRHGDLLEKRNILTSEVRRYSYDIFGQIKRVEASPTLVVDYLTDGENRRAQVKVNGVTTKSFLHNERGQLVGQLDANGNFESRFVYASQGHSPDFMVRAGLRYLFVKDQLGSIRMVVDAVSGTVAQRIDYDEFGRVLSDSNPGFQPFGFAGGLYDHNTGLVRFGARDYDAELGRWTAKDPILFESGELSLYTYSDSDPVNKYDPEGLLGRPLIYGPEGLPDDQCNQARSCKRTVEGLNFIGKCVGAICARIPGLPQKSICAAGVTTYIKAVEVGAELGCNNLNRCGGE